MPRFEQGLAVNYAPLGHAQVTVSNEAVSLPGIPVDTVRVRRVVIRNLGAPINWRDDGVDPTSAVGFHSMADEILVTDISDVTKFRMIRADGAATDADVRVAFYG